MIIGDLIQVRPMLLADTDDVIRMRSEASVLSQLFSAAPPTREEHLGWLERIQKQEDRQEFVIVERRTGRTIGTIGLSNIDRRHQRAEFGILIGASDARGKGFALEASQLLLDYAFNKLGLHRIYLFVFPENEAAIQLYQKLGFQQEGLLHQHVFKDDRFRDVVVFALLRVS